MFRKTVKKILTIICTNISKYRLGSYGKGLHVNFFCKFTRNTFVGENCHFNGIIISGHGKVIIGNNFHSGKKCCIITDNHNFYGKSIPYDNTFISKDVHIHDNVWLGEHVAILGGVTIGEGVIIQAYSVVCKDIPPLAIAGGHPAVPFKYRNVEHYEKLKNEGKFF